MLHAAFDNTFKGFDPLLIGHGVRIVFGLLSKSAADKF